MVVGSDVLHRSGNTLVTRGGCSSSALSYDTVAAVVLAAVAVCTTARANVVTHSNWEWFCLRAAHQEEGRGREGRGGGMHAEANMPACQWGQHNSPWTHGPPSTSHSAGAPASW
jgi:hypothetical protein